VEHVHIMMPIGVTGGVIVLEEFGVLVEDNGRQRD
jgi:hypothetical protein